MLTRKVIKSGQSIASDIYSINHDMLCYLISKLHVCIETYKEVYGSTC